MSKNQLLKRACAFGLLGLMSLGALANTNYPVLKTEGPVSERIQQLVDDLRESNSTGAFADIKVKQTINDKYPISQTLMSAQKGIFDPIVLDVENDNVIRLNLDKVVSYALHNSFTQRMHWNDAKQYKWDFVNSVSRMLPSVFLTHDYLYQDGRSSFFSKSTGSPIASRDNFITQLGLSSTLSLQSVFNSMVTYNQWKAMTKEQKVQTQFLLHKASILYHELIRSRAELGIRMHAVEHAREHLKLNQELFNSGVSTRFAVIQSEEQLAENELALTEQQGIARSTEIQLLDTLNLPFTHSIHIEDTKLEKQSIFAYKNTNVNKLVQKAVAKRPEISRDRLAWLANKHKTKQAWASFTPSVNASLTATGAKADISDFGDLNDFRNASVGFQWTLLEGLGLGQISAISARDYEARKAYYKLQEQIKVIRGEVRAAYLKITASEGKMKVSQRQLEAATEGINLALLRVKNGVGTNIDLIDSQRNYINAMINKARSVSEFNQAQIDLMKSIGEVSPKSLLQNE